MYDGRRLHSVASSGLRATAKAVLGFGREPATRRIFRRAWGTWVWAGLFVAAIRSRAPPDGAGRL